MFTNIALYAMRYGVAVRRSRFPFSARLIFMSFCRIMMDIRIRTES